MVGQHVELKVRGGQQAVNKLCLYLALCHLWFLFLGVLEVEGESCMTSFGPPPPFTLDEQGQGR